MSSFQELEVHNNSEAQRSYTHDGMRVILLVFCLKVIVNVKKIPLNLEKTTSSNLCIVINLQYQVNLI